MNKKILLLLLLTVSKTQALTLKEAVTAALSNQKTLQLKELDYQNSQLDLRESEGSRLPSLTANGTASFPFNGDIPIGVGQYNLGLNLNVPLYQGGALEAKYRASVSNNQSSFYDLQKAKNEVILLSIQTYLNYLSLSKQLAIAQKDAEIATSNLNRIERLYEKGIVSKTDLSLAKSRQFSSKVGLELATNQLKMSEIDFKNIIGVEPVNLKELTSLPVIPNQFKDYLNQVQLGDNELKAASYQREGLYYQSELLLAPDLPKLGLSLQLGKTLATNADHLANYGIRTAGASRSIYSDSDNFSATAVVSFSMPIFNGGLNYVHYRKMKLTKNIADIQYKLKLEVAEKRFINDWDQLKTLALQLQFITEQRNYSDQFYIGVQKEFEKNLKNSLDLLSAQKDWLQTQKDFFKISNDYTLAHYKILANINKLSVETIKD